MNATPSILLLFFFTQIALSESPGVEKSNQTSEVKLEAPVSGELEASIDALLLGSYTYEFALKLGQWPSPDKLSWVFTRRDLRILHPSITLTTQSPREILELMASRGLRRAWLMGGGKLAASFHADQLISRYVISVFPVLLGSGIPLFAPHSSPPDALRFVVAKPFKSGIVQIIYERAPKTDE
jgi:dihydrofolate reductase